MMFHPDRLLVGREPDEIERPSIVVALAGDRTQLIRIDAFSKGAHYHIRPMRGGQQLPLAVKDGQTPLTAALSFFDDVAAQVQNAALLNAAAPQGHSCAAWGSARSPLFPKCRKPTPAPGRIPRS
jgi:hypothetical protein